MNQLLSSIARVALALAVLALVAPEIIRLLHSLVPVVLLVFGLAVLLRAAWALMDRK